MFPSYFFLILPGRIINIHTLGEMKKSSPCKYSKSSQVMKITYDTPSFFIEQEICGQEFYSFLCLSWFMFTLLTFFYKYFDMNIYSRHFNHFVHIKIFRKKSKKCKQKSRQTLEKVKFPPKYVQSCPPNKKCCIINRYTLHLLSIENFANSAKS